MTIHDIRKRYLDFFKDRQHAIIPSASLIPENDPTTLFTGSGMQPIVPYLLGEKHAQGVRISDSQKCFRTQDIEEVGDNRHTTFFEMLGNWSLGDYFKEEQLSWAFDFLIKELGLDPKNLYVTVFRGNAQIPRDEDSVMIWKKIFSDVGIEALDIDYPERDGMQSGRIFYYDESKNWWSRNGVPEKMPIGDIGGPDSELFWDFGIELDFHDKSPYKNSLCHVNCDCGRFLEIGNNVFMEYIKTKDGFEILPHKNVDFGGGLMRIAAAMNGNPDIFAVDAFKPAIDLLEKLSIKSYDSNEEITRSMRVVLDHLCAATFLIGDDVYPSNKDQGYFVRRLIRRAVRFGKKLGIEKEFIADIGKVYINDYKEAYPELGQKEERILSELSLEEDRFSKTITKGERVFDKLFEEKGKISGEDAFILYSTYGFPIELSEEMAMEHGQIVDKEIFMSEFRNHQNVSKAGSAQKFAGGLADHSDEVVKLHTATHMLHQALRTVLGDHVEQKGSNITAERLRFDFSHSEKLTKEQVEKVEHMINENIQKNLPVYFEMLSLSQAKERGAIGLFEDKYAQLGEQIKVYFIGDDAFDGSYSKEVCGGPHVKNTGELGHFKIKKEESTSSGVRRIKAILEQKA